MSPACFSVTLLLCISGLAQDKGLDETPRPVASWRFSETNFTGGVVSDTTGELDIRLTKGGLTFTGKALEEAVLLPEGARALRIAEDVDPSTILPGPEFSIAAWVRMDEPRKWAGVFSTIQDNGDHERGWAAGINGDQFYLGLRTEGSKNITYLFSNQRAKPNHWYHFLATYDGTRMRLFVNGVLDAESTEQSGAIAWPEMTNVSIGAYEDADERYPLLGALHSVELFDISLEEPAVAEIHAQYAGAFPEPTTPEDQLLARNAEDIVGWPMYRRDPQRSAATSTPLKLPLASAWQYSLAPPRPSWPEPAQRSFWQNLDEVVPRVVFDLAHHPVSDGRVVVVASSRDDHVRCLDLETGQLRWSVGTDGPIRFAPLIDGDGVIVASDDGHLYRMNLLDGSIEWKTRLAPEDRRIPGNGRLISAWPIRTGPVLDRGLLHATSGLFPRFGTYAFALDPATGEVVWKRPLPGISPQGYLLASPSRLFVPTGRTSPSMLGRGDGRTMGTFELPGGTFALLLEDELVSGPGSSGELVPANIRTRETAAGFRADRGIVVPEFIILQRGDVLSALDRTALLEIRGKRSALLAKQTELEGAIKSGNSSATQPLANVRLELESNLAELEACELWRREFRGQSLALAGDQLLVGGDGEVVIFDVRSGTPKWRRPIDGKGMGLAIAGGRLLVASDRGTLHVFEPGESAITQAAEANPNQPQLPTVLPAELLALISEAGMDRGIAIVVDPVNGDTALELATKTALHVVVLDEDPGLITRIRSRALAQGIYGDGLVAHVTDREASPFIDGIANLIVSEEGLLNDDATTLGPEIVGLLRPAGGILLGAEYSGDTPEIQLVRLPGLATPAWMRKPLPGAANWTHPYANSANTAASLDERVGGETSLQWFGGPGPARMIDRHLRTTASLAHGGRLFIPANDAIIGVDAYNGIELWETPLPGFSRTGAPYDGGWWAVNDAGIFAATKDDVAQLDPRDGSIIGRHHVPPEARHQGATEWGWLALDNGLLLGSAAIKGTSRSEQNRDAVVEQYKEFLPLATSRAMFAIDPETNTTRWVYRGGVIPHSAIAMKDGRVFFLESKDTQSTQGRVDLATMRNSGLQLVSLDAASGREVWREELTNVKWEHSVYLSCSQDAIILIGSHNENEQNRYSIGVYDADRGAHRWSAEHNNNRAGIGGDHGEQVHHPVVFDDFVVAEPLIYDLASGDVIDPTQRNGFSIRSRSGCGTISGSASCVFFRDGNPTMVDLAPEGGTWRKLTHSSRPGCWVNIIPSQGLILMPESSAGCVCGFSLQTSMALVPVAPKN